MLIKAQCIHGELTRFHFVNNDAVAVISKPHMVCFGGSQKLCGHGIYYRKSLFHREMSIILVFN